MVVIKPTKIESICESLESLMEFFRDSQSSSTDATTLANVEHDLINLEAKLAVFSNYTRHYGRNKDS